MSRSSTPLFKLVDRLRGKRPRPGVDHVLAAGVCQQNGLEAWVWGVIVTGFTAALVVWLLLPAGLGQITTLILSLPITFVALHVVCIAIGSLAMLLPAGNRGLMRIYLVAYSSLAVWCIAQPGWIRFAGWFWLSWIVTNTLAWIINTTLEPSTVDSQ